MMKRTFGLFAALLFVSFGAFARDNCKGLKKTALAKCENTAAAALLKSDVNPLLRAPRVDRERKQQSDTRLRHAEGNGNGNGNANGQGKDHGKPNVITGKKGGSSKADLRTLPQTPPEKVERQEVEGPDPNPVMAEPADDGSVGAQSLKPAPELVPHVTAQAPAPIANFDGLDFQHWGAGHPPDTNGDVGPTYYIQTINTSIGIFEKSTGNRVAAFTFNTFAQGKFGNLCDTNNFGDPVVVYDSFEDRWIITDFAFTLGGGQPVAPDFQCIAVSMSGDPVSGGWNYYSIPINDLFGDYPKFAVWPDGLYMSANMFGFGGGSFSNSRVFAFNKAQMYAGNPTLQAVFFDVPPGDFTLIPSNARLQTGTPPPGTPNYFLSTWVFLNGVTVYKFHVDWDRISLSTFTGPDVPIAATSWPNASVPNAPSLGGNALDVLQIRAMVQNQYTNIGGVESLWATHTVRRGVPPVVTGFAAPRWYQVNVTGGAVAATIPQATTWDPDGANVMYRFMPSIAVDRAGDVALGYSTSSATTKPAIKYAGRLAGDPINTFSQSEQTLIQGAGTQVGNCGGAPCIRWGDYSAMSLDPDGCTFWYTNMYYADNSLFHLTRVGSFSYPTCTPVGAGGNLSGTVTTSGAPVSGATVAFGSRVTTTNASGAYAFLAVPAGTYQGPVVATFPGLNPGSASNVVINDGGTTTLDFTLSSTGGSACFTDTTSSDFQRGTLTNVDAATVPDSVILTNQPRIDQTNTSLANSGFNVTTTQWIGQTFVPAVTGTVVRLDINMFCGGCSGANPPVTLDIRATSGGLPTSAIIASTTIPGFSSGSGGYFTATFNSPPTLTAGTTYAIMTRLTAARAAGNYDATISAANPYSRGTLVFTTNGGASFGNIAADDLGFKVFMQTGFSPSGTLVSGLMDANPAGGATPTWPALNWNATTPAGTSLTFQVAASNSAFGPFNFVGPFTNGASLAQFNGNRYLRYQVLFSTSNGAVTPALNDVSICYVANPQPVLVAAPATGTFGGVSNLAATLTSGGTPVSGKAITFSVDAEATNAGTATTDASGVATFALSLGTRNAGAHTFTVKFDGDTSYTAASGSSTLTISRADATIFVAPYSVIYDGHAHTATGTATGALGESLAGLDLTGTTHTDAGSYTDTWTFTDATNNYNNATGTVTDNIGKVSAANITINGFTGVYDGLPHGATGSATGVNGENLSGLLSFDRTFTNVPGGTVTWAFAGNVDYNSATGTAAINISAAPLTVTANNAARLYGTANPPFSASYSGFVNGETLATSGVSGTPAFSTTATQFSAAGAYPITPSLGTLTANNYSFVFVAGSLTVYESGLIGLNSALIGSNKAVVDSFDSGSGTPGSNAPVLSNGAITVTGAKVSGNLVSTGGNVTLQSGSVLNGNVVAGGTVTNRGTVTGSIAQNQLADPLVAPAVPSCGAFTVNPSITGGTFTYANGDLSVGGTNTVMIAPGSYCFHNVTLGGQAHVQVSGAVSITVSGVLNAAGGSFVNATHVPANLQIASSFNGPAGVTISGGPSAYLTVYAPMTDVAITGNASFFGAALGKTLTIAGSPDVHYDTALPNVWGVYFGF
jgi:hypothetical protein